MATAKIIELNESNSCKICQTALGKYICPKCNILYCSLSCYRSKIHQNCSEQFYKDHIFEELKLNENNPEDQLKMLSILKSSNNSFDVPTYLDDDNIQASSPTESYDSDDDIETDSLQERLAGIDLDDAEQVWASLNEDERKDFIALTQDFKTKNIIHNWKPWWTLYYNGKVQEVDSNSSSYKTKCPIIKNISEFEGICRQNPHVNVKFNLYNILAGYTFVSRYFNGEYSLFPKETISFIAIIAPSLHTHQDFVNLQSVFESIEGKIIENDWIMCDMNSVSIMMKDLEKIISGPTDADKNYYVLAAICDIHNLLKKSISKNKKDNGDVMSKAFIDEHFPISSIHTLKEMKLYMKRIEYFVSYVHNYYKILI